MATKKEEAKNLDRVTDYVEDKEVKGDVRIRRFEPAGFH